MKRKWFILIILLMSVSLFGIILIQLYWINNAIKLKETQFDQNVNTAMKEIAGIIEKKENVVLISDKLKSFERSIITGTDGERDTISSVSAERPKPEATIDVVEDVQDDDVYLWNGSIDVDGKNAISFISDGKQVSITSEDLAVDISVDLDYDSLRQTIQTIKGFYKIDTLSNAIFSRYIYTYSAGDSQNYLILSHPVAKTAKAKKLGQVFERMVIEAEDLTKPIEELYSAEDLGKVIQYSLLTNSVDQDFEFAIQSGDENIPYPVISENFNDVETLDSYRVSLFPEEIYEQKNYQLLLKFPEKSIHLLKSVSLLMMASILLTLFIIATFGTTIYMILRQKKISDIKSDFINNMTHEFKTPIATISLAVDSINNPKTLDNKDNILYYTGIIKEENKRMNAQVENVLQMSLLDKHEIEFNMQSYDLHGLIRDAIRQILLQLEERKGRIEVNFNAGMHFGLVDEVHFTNAILNLLDNANKYSPEKPEIIISTENIDHRISIKVSDKGAGMSKDIQKKIFEKFYRQTSGNIHDIKGFGLGLTYVKAIIQVMKGQIKIQSEPGKGSTFEIILPIVEDHA